MRTRKCKVVLFLTAVVLAAAAMAGILVSQPEIIAQTEAGDADATAHATPVVSDDPSVAANGDIQDASSEQTTDVLLAQLAEISQGSDAQSVTMTDRQIMDSVSAAHDMLRSGQVWEGSLDLLNVLHELPDTAAAVDDGLAPISLLTFSICLLMEPETRQAFIKEALDPETYPIDDLVLACFYTDYRDYDRVHPTKLISPEELKQFVENLTTSKSPLVRMGALALTVSVNWDSSAADMLFRAVDVLNRMALECPDSRITKETFRELLMPCCGKGFTNPEGIESVLQADCWNEAMDKVIAEDPVVQTLHSMNALKRSDQAKAANEQENELHLSFAVAESHPNAEVRDWFVRAFAPCTLRSYKDVARKADIKESFTRKVLSATQEDGSSETVPLDVARAEFLLFVTGGDQAAPEYADNLLHQSRDMEPVGMNLFELIPRRINNRAHELINEGDREGAKALLQPLVDAYPGSYLARRSQETIDILNGKRK